jgi:hypothetical protein
LVAVGEDLRHAADTLVRLEGRAETLQLESRPDEVWWRSTPGKGPSSLRRSEAAFRHR